MAEQYVPREEMPDVYQVDGVDLLEESLQGSTEGDVIHVDFRPDPTMGQIQQRIGEVATSWLQTEAGSEAISHELIYEAEDTGGNVYHRYKQYNRGFNGIDNGILHPQGLTGTETIIVSDFTRDASSQTIKHFQPDVRNLKFSLRRPETRRIVHHSDNPAPTVSKGSRNRPAG